MALVLCLAAHPAMSLPAATGDPHALKAADRFFGNEAVTPQAIREAHRGRALDRIRPLRRILFLQDTTELDYTDHPETTGLGTLACSPHQGLLVHTTMAITETGEPLGVGDQQVWTRAPKETGKAPPRPQRPLAEKESRRCAGQSPRPVAATRNHHHC